jgi:mannose-6-phosphate isomerase-like protein (cupin superfamily)
MRRFIAERDAQGVARVRELTEPDTARVLIPSSEMDAANLPREVGAGSAFEAAGPGSGEILVTKVFTAPDVSDAITAALGRSAEPLVPARVRDVDWQVTHFGPRVSTPMHESPGLVYGYFLEGEITLVFETNEMQLFAGDSVFLPTDLPHAWRTGDAPCLRVAAILV